MTIQLQFTPMRMPAIRPIVSVRIIAASARVYAATANAP